MSGLIVPTKINDRFLIADPLNDLVGRGAMGAVYRGLDLHTGGAVAVKRLRSEVLAGNPDLVERFAREGEALRQLNHPNIVKAIAAVTEAEQHYLILEYVAGGSLRELLDSQQERPLPYYRIVSIALDLADALTRAHRLNIIHRDLKPANVLIGADGSPRLTDFGLAQMGERRRDGSRLTETGVLMGTMDYLSPELCSGKSADGRSDIWAFGVMLFEMTAGQRPFAAPTLAGLITAILTQPVPDLHQFRPDVNDALADLIYRMLEKDPLRRIPSIRLVGAELEAILQSSDIRHNLTPSVLAAKQIDQTVPHFQPGSSERANAPRHNLPIQANLFVGRRRELDELSQMIADPASRLIVVVGPGGIGKTRLALEAAASHLAQFTGGVYHISLTAAQTADDLAAAIANAVSYIFHEGESVERQLVNYLREKHILLVVDNLEQGQMTAVSPFLTAILQNAPQVTLLITARERLRLSEEQLYVLTGLDPSQTLTADSPAAQLFAQSARRMNPAFELTAADLPAMSEINRLVGGAPLGLILAAGWVEMLSITEIAAEIGQNLDFLETDMRDVPERQRSLRAVFDYAWNLLAPSEREALQRLAVFPGSFTRAAAQAVSQASLRELIALANRALLYRDLDGRYEIQGLLQQFALEQLRRAADLDAAQERHADYFAHLAADYDLGLKGDRQQATLAEIELEHDNLRAAWEWALAAGKSNHLSQLIDSLCRFYEWRGRYRDGAAILQTAVSQLPHLPGAAARQVEALALIWQSAFATFLGETDKADRALRRSLTLLDESDLAALDGRPQRAFALWQLSRAAAFNGNQPEAQSCAERSLALYEELGDEWGAANALYALGQSFWHRGAYADASPLYERSLALFQKRKDQRGAANALRAMGTVALYQGRLQDTFFHMRQSGDIRKAIGDRAGTAVSLADLGSAYMLAGDFAAATQNLEESVAIYLDLGYRQAVGHWSCLLGLAYLSGGDPASGRRCVEQGLNFSQQVGYQRGIALANWLQGCLAIGAGDYDLAEHLFGNSVTLYREIGQRDELAWVLACGAMGLILTGQLDKARARLAETLQIAAELRSFLPLSFALPAIALLRAKTPASDEAELVALRSDAVRIYALAARYPSAGKSQFITQATAPGVAEAAAQLDEATADAARQEGATADLFAVVGRLLSKLS